MFTWRTVIRYQSNNHKSTLIEVQSYKTVSAYYTMVTSKQMLPFGFYRIAKLALTP